MQHLGDLPRTEVTVTDETMDTPTAMLLVGVVDGLSIVDSAAMLLVGAVDGFSIVDSVVGVLMIAPAVWARALALRGSSIEHPVACPHPGKVRDLYDLRCGSLVPGPRW